MMTMLPAALALGSALALRSPPLPIRPTIRPAGGFVGVRTSGNCVPLRASRTDERATSEVVVTSIGSERREQVARKRIAGDGENASGSEISSEAVSDDASLVEALSYSKAKADLIPEGEVPLPTSITTSSVGEFAFEDAAETTTLGGDDEGEGLLEPLVWRGAVVVLCALWASNFAAAKLILAEPGVDSALYAVTRFAVAALALLPGAVAAARRSGLDLATARDAAVCGGWVAFGYLGQTLGLLTTTASRSCVICSLHCVFVALLAELYRVSNAATGSAADKFDLRRLAPAALAVVGVAIVELKGAGGDPTIGDLLSLAQPVGFGMGYLQLEEIMAKRPDAALPVSAIKLAVVALASLGLFELSPLIDTFAAGGGGDVGAGLAEGLQALWPPRVPDFAAVLLSPVALGGVLYTGLVTTALALWVESVAFARVPATDASIILTTEPLFAAAFGAAALGETFGMSDYVGASVIVGACVLAALLDNPGEGEEGCNVEMDDRCEPPRKWPFWGF